MRLFSWVVVVVLGLLSFLSAVPAGAAQLFPPINVDGQDSCPNGTVLQWLNNGVSCVDPSPGTTVNCGPGQVMTGMTSGTASCKNIPANCPYGLAYDGTNFTCAGTHFVTVTGTAGWSPPDQYGGYYADAYIACPTGSFLTGGGGYCDSNMGGFLFGSLPSNNGWAADCHVDGGAGEPSGSATAYAICEYPQAGN